ncbi:MAG: hypothetical protein ACR2JE_00075 [Acidobacteriaceae bacterium]
MLVLLLPTCAQGARTCVSPAQAATMAGKDLCVATHIYDIVVLEDGTRLLDTCAPETGDDACRFTLVSFQRDGKDVGNLEQYRGHDVQVRGIYRAVKDRGLLVVSHARQFHGGEEKFRPNPALLSGFEADGDKTAFRDPALSGSRHHSSFKSVAH